MTIRDVLLEDLENFTIDEEGRLYWMGREILLKEPPPEADEAPSE